MSSSASAGRYTGAAEITSFRFLDESGSFVMIGNWDKNKATEEGCSNASKWVVAGDTTGIALERAKSV
ncbi:MAG: hypothetical protein MK096_15050 [Oleiphilaceae bacterium]|nr:hypothetical protein [Oleiphilaceae bacterium]